MASSFDVGARVGMEKVANLPRALRGLPSGAGPWPMKSRIAAHVKGRQKWRDVGKIYRDMSRSDVLRLAHPDIRVAVSKEVVRRALKAKKAMEKVAKLPRALREFVGRDETGHLFFQMAPGTYVGGRHAGLQSSGPDAVLRHPLIANRVEDMFKGRVAAEDIARIRRKIAPKSPRVAKILEGTMRGSAKIQARHEVLTGGQKVLKGLKNLGKNILRGGR